MARTTVLIDAGPDLREQLLDAGVTRLDGVLLTHEHADHTHGIDDVRPLVIHQRRRIDVYMDAETSATMRARFGYCFATPPGSEYPPILTEHRIHAGEPVTIEGPGGPITALPFRLVHGAIEALGFRIGGLAYSADVSAIPPDSVGALEDLDTWIIDALRDTPHPSHFCLADALAWIERMRPRRAILTNLHTDLDYQRAGAAAAGRRRAGVRRPAARRGAVTRARSWANQPAPQCPPDGRPDPPQSRWNCNDVP